MICSIVGHYSNVDVSVPMCCVSSDVDFEYLFQLLKCALNLCYGLRVFQSGMVKFNSGGLHKLSHEL